MTPTQDLRAAVAELPSSDDPQFDFAVPAMLEELGPSRVDLEALTFDGDPEVAFAALYSLLTLVWRDRDFGDYRRIVEAARGRFGQVPLFESLMAQALSCSSDVRTLEDGLRRARRAMELTPGRPGVQHTYAALVASLADAGRTTDNELLEAEMLLRSCLQQNPRYAKYHAALAQILTALGRFDEAKREVAQAIEIEPPTGRHYALRIGDYQDIRMSISFAEAQAALTAQQERISGDYAHIRDEVAAMRTQSFELLGLLAAVVAFVVTGVQVATKMALEDAAGLMTAIAAAIVGVFAAFSLLYGSPGRERRAAVLLSAAVLAVAGIWLGSSLS